MKAARVKVASAVLADPAARPWARAASETLRMVPTPLALVREVSPFLAGSSDHGQVTELSVALLHNGEALALRLSWAAPKPVNSLVDLDRFVDGVAAIFPLAEGASAVTMGSPGRPANAWYWKAGADAAWDVIAEGYGTSRRSAGAALGLSARAVHDDGHWQVVLQRPLDAGAGHVRFTPGGSGGIAFAVWSGDNRERSGRKSFSGEFLPLELAP